MADVLVKIPVDISASGTTSSAINIADWGGSDQHRLVIVGVQTPSNLTSTSMEISPVDDSGNILTFVDSLGAAKPAITVTTSDLIALDPNDYLAVSKFKVVMGSAEGAARVIKVICRVL